MINKEDCKKRILSKSEYITETGCLIWGAALNRGGYGMAWDGKATKLAHRVSYLAFFNEIPDSICVLHKCDTPSCVNPNHLFLGSHQDNANDKTKKKRNGIPQRDGHWNTKLKSHDVDEIKKSFISGSRDFGIRALSKKFKVSRTTIRYALGWK